MQPDEISDFYFTTRLYFCNTETMMWEKNIQMHTDTWHDWTDGCSLHLVHYDGNH